MAEFSCLALKFRTTFLEVLFLNGFYYANAKDESLIDVSTVFDGLSKPSYIAPVL